MLEDLFPKRLKQLRKEKKLTQLKLSIVLGVHVNSVKRWEKGERFPGPGDIQALAQALGVPIRDLMTFPSIQRSNKKSMRVAGEPRPLLSSLSTPHSSENIASSLLRAQNLNHHPQISTDSSPLVEIL